MCGVIDVVSTHKTSSSSSSSLQTRDAENASCAGKAVVTKFLWEELKNKTGVDSAAYLPGFSAEKGERFACLPVRLPRTYNPL